MVLCFVYLCIALFLLLYRTMSYALNYRHQILNEIEIKNMKNWRVIFFSFELLIKWNSEKGTLQYAIVEHLRNFYLETHENDNKFSWVLYSNNILYFLLRCEEFVNYIKTLWRYQPYTRCTKNMYFQHYEKKRLLEHWPKSHLLKENFKRPKFRSRNIFTGYYYFAKW